MGDTDDLKPDAPAAPASAPESTAPSPTTTSAAAVFSDERAGEGTAFAYARRLVEQKVPRAEAVARLREKGFDEESARLALNAVDGATPSELPDATLAPGINPLSPGSFALSDVGLQGNPATVALYWMAFGAVVLVLVSVLLLLPEFGVGEPLTPASLFWGRVGLGLGGLALGWGLFRLLTSVRVRRRPSD